MYFKFDTLGPFLVAIVDAKHVIREESYMENTMNDRRKEVYEGEPSNLMYGLIYDRFGFEVKKIMHEKK